MDRDLISVPSGLKKNSIVSREKAHSDLFIFFLSPGNFLYLDSPMTQKKRWSWLYLYRFFCISMVTFISFLI